MKIPAIDLELGRETPHIAVVMVNPGERYPWRRPYARNLRPNSEAWQAEFEDKRRDEWKLQHGAKLDKLMRAMKKRGIAVYFVGLPILGSRMPLTTRRSSMNSFASAPSSTACASSTFSRHSPTTAPAAHKVPISPAKSAKCASVTVFASRKPATAELAYFVEREIKRDIAQARTERSIPLAGTEAERRRIRPAATATAGFGARPVSRPSREPRLVPAPRRGRNP